MLFSREEMFSSLPHVEQEFAREAYLEPSGSTSKESHAFSRPGI